MLADVRTNKQHNRTPSVGGQNKNLIRKPKKMSGEE